MFINVVAGFCTNDYQGGDLQSNNYGALPWCVGTAVNDTHLKKAHQSETWKYSRLIAVSDNRNGTGQDGTVLTCSAVKSLRRRGGTGR